MSAYLNQGEVVATPGRLQAFWANMTGAMRDVLIAEASAKVDEILGMPDEGVFQQLGKTVKLSVSVDRDTLFLPNKPITNVTSITVTPRDGGSYSLPVRMTDAPGLPATVRVWNGQGFQYTGDPSGQTVIPSFGRAEIPFQEDDRVTVVYDCGYTPDKLPRAIKRATRLILASMLFSESDNPQGAFSISQEGVHVTYGTSRGGEVNPTEDAAMTDLQPYRLEVFNN